jgi:hypothetical protein
VDAALSGNGAVYDIDFFRLIVDINGNGTYEVGADLTINLGAVVTDLTAGTDLLVL